MSYEVKNNCSLFERLFKIKENGISLFGIYSFILDILLCFYIMQSDDVISSSIKTVQHRIKNISRNIRAVFFKLGIRSAPQKKKQKQNGTHFVIAMKTVLPLGLFKLKLKFPVFTITGDHQLPTI